MITTGPKNCITDVPGIRVGQARDARVKTGVTVILPDAPAFASVDVRGGGPGTREISALADGGLIDRVHAIVLSGGSVYGLAAADGVAAQLGAAGIGYAAGPPPIPVSPIVPSAILFDNANGGDKAWGAQPPFRALGIAAYDAAQDDVDEGAHGAGHGATAGIYPGGIGTASEVVSVPGGDIIVGAIIAANPVGSPYWPGTDCPYAAPYETSAEFGGARLPPDYAPVKALDTKLAMLAAREAAGASAAGQSTVIGCIAVSAGLSQSNLKRLAIMAQDGLPMAVQPAHTPLDGDTIFALGVGEARDISPVTVSIIGAAAARTVARALTRGVIAAR